MMPGAALKDCAWAGAGLAAVETLPVELLLSAALQG
jgi:hypothetical protein